MFYFRGNVLGRKKIGVKVCSCSKRDILKEEHLKEKRLTGINADNKHTSLANSCESSENKLKINNDNSEDKIYKLPAVCIFILFLNLNIIITIIRKILIITIIFSYLLFENSCI